MQQSQTTTPTNTMAIVSLITGILSWVVLPFIGAIVAIVTGHMARSQIKQSAEGGDILAIIGLILGYLHLISFCAGLLIFLLIFGGAIGLGGCALLSDAVSYIDTSSIVVP